MIDKIKTKEDVKAFLLLINYTPDIFMPREYGEYGNDTFYKFDINKDGLKDLLVSGFKCISIVDNGDGRFKCAEPGIAGPLIKIDSSAMTPKLYYKNGAVVVYHFNGFSMYNPTPSQYEIDSIRIEFTECHGPCPIFEMRISKSHKAYYTATAYNERTGIFEAIISDKDWKEMIELLNYIQFDKLISLGDTTIVDAPTRKLYVRYFDNKIKELTYTEQYSSTGTKHFYSLIKKWRLYQKWVKIRDIEEGFLNGIVADTTNNPTPYLVD